MKSSIYEKRQSFEVRLNSVISFIFVSFCQPRILGYSARDFTDIFAYEGQLVYFVFRRVSSLKALLLFTLEAIWRNVVIYSNFHLRKIFVGAFIFVWFCVISPLNVYFCCSLHWSMFFVAVFVFRSLAYVLHFFICPFCQAGYRLVKLERKVLVLEQEKSLETTCTDGTLKLV